MGEKEGMGGDGREGSIREMGEKEGMGGDGREESIREMGEKEGMGGDGREGRHGGRWERRKTWGEMGEKEA